MTLPLPGTPRRLVYLGTPAMAVPTLDALVDAGYDVALVITGVDARRTRRGEPEPSPVKRAALAHGIPVSHEVTDALQIDADLGVVVAFGRIIPAAVLDKVPMVNLHFSLLPRWRGAAPVERALLAGDERTGVCVMDVAEALDEGAVFARREVIIGVDATLESLRDELVTAGTDLLLTGLDEGFGVPEAQQGQSHYAAKITSEDRRVNFGDGAEAVRRVVSLGNAWTTFRGKRFKIWQVRSLQAAEPAVPASTIVVVGDGTGPWVAAGREWVELIEVQPEGKPRMAALGWVNGARLVPGDRLGS